MNNRTSLFVIGGIIIFAIIGIIGMFLANPTGFLQRIAVIALIGIAIYFIARLITKANPQKREQRAFLRAAKKSKKRLQQKSGDPHVRSASQTTLTKSDRSHVVP